MGEGIIITYLSLFIVLIFGTVITRLVLVLRLYAIRDGKIFDRSVDGEILSFLASLTLPFKLKEDLNDQRSGKIIRMLNRLRQVYWWTMLSLAVFIIIVNVLEHVFGMEKPI